jgi:alkylated DNA nucleotide flippase Atl1
MPNPSSSARLRRDLVVLLGRVPRGWVAAIGDVSRHLAAYQPHVAQVLASIGEEAEGEADVPWWRVVADGGAVGRHPRRDVQIKRLKADGLVVSLAGIVQEMAERRIKDLAAPPSEPFAGAAPPSVDARPARSRGFKSHPGA